MFNIFCQSKKAFSNKSNSLTVWKNNILFPQPYRSNFKHFLLVLSTRKQYVNNMLCLLLDLSFLTSVDSFSYENQGFNSLTLYLQVFDSHICFLNSFFDFIIYVLDLFPSIFFSYKNTGLWLQVRQYMVIH